MFVAKLAPGAKQALAAAPPRLQADEIAALRWFKLSELEALLDAGKLHPIVAQLLTRHRSELRAAAGI